MSGALLVLLKRYMFPYLYSLWLCFAITQQKYQKYKIKMDTHTHMQTTINPTGGEKKSHHKTPSTAYVSAPCHKPTQVNRKYRYLTTTILFT